MREIIVKLFFLLKIKSRQRIANTNLNHVLFFLKSNRATQEIIAKPNHGFFSQLRQRIAKQNLKS
jgi:hypothetical protein